MPSESPSRNRLLAAAEDLFYHQGISATGVDAVSRAARVTKPTLYAHFPSKAELVAAVLQQRHERRATEVEEWLVAVAASERPLAFFDWLGAFYQRDGQRGCAFLNAAAELPARDDPGRAAVHAEKVWLRELLVRLCREAGYHDTDRLGSVLLLLVDGLAGRILVFGPSVAPQAVADARAAADFCLQADKDTA